MTVYTLFSKVVFKNIPVTLRERIGIKLCNELKVQMFHMFIYKNPYVEGHLGGLVS